MKKFEFVLSIRQMKELMDLGIDVTNANMYYWCGMEDMLSLRDPSIEFIKNDEGNYTLGGKEMCVPTFTLQDICEIMDKTVHCVVLSDMDGFYAEPLSSEKKLHTEYGGDILYNAYNMLKWCKQNNMFKDE